MSIVHLDPQKLSATNFHVVKVQQHLSTSVASLKQLQKQCLWMNNALYLQSAQTLWQIASIQKKLFAIDCYVKESGAMYESLERCLHAQAKMLSNASDKNTQGQNQTILTIGKQFQSLIQKKEITSSDQTKIQPSSYRKWNVREMDGYAQFDHNFSFQSLLRTLKDNKLRASFEVGGSAMALTYAQRFCGIKHQLDIGFMNVDMNANASAALFNEHMFDPKLNLAVGASASLAHGIITDRWSNSFTNIKTKIIGEVGVAYVQGSAVISKDEVKLSGDVGAAAFRGKASGVIEFMGITISGSVSGDVASVGIGATLSASKDSFEIGGNLSCLLGGGFDLKIEW